MSTIRTGRAASRATHTPDRAIARLARRQHGAWSRRQALAAEFTSSMIETRLLRGHWVQLDTAVYAHAASLPTWERSIMAAILAEPWALASHRTAAVLHELRDFRRGRPEITIRPGANARGRLAIAHRGVDTRSTTIDFLPVTTVEQTFVDLAQVVTERRLRAAFSHKAERHETLVDAVRDRYCALAPRGGRDLRNLRSVLDRFGAGEAIEVSELERVMRRVLASPAIPDIEWEAPFPGRSPGPSRVDGLIRPWRTILEADGRKWHTRLEDFERDRRRDAEAAAAGFLTLRFTYYQLVNEAAWAQDIVVDAGEHRFTPG